MNETIFKVLIIESDPERSDRMRAILGSSDGGIRSVRCFPADETVTLLDPALCGLLLFTSPPNDSNLINALPLGMRRRPALILAEDAGSLTRSVDLLIESGWDQSQVEGETIQSDAYEKLLLPLTRAYLSRNRERELRATYQLELKNQKALFSAVADNLNIGVVFHDFAAKVVYINDAACEIMGLPAGEILGRTLADPLFRATLEDGAPVSEECHPTHRALAARQNLSEVILRVFNHVEGRARLIRHDVILVDCREGLEPIALCTLLNDVTHRRRLEDERRQFFVSRLEAERSVTESLILSEETARLASLGLMAAGITHEINQPLSAIQVYADTALYLQQVGRFDLPESIVKILKGVQEGTQRIDEIIRHVRSYWSSSPHSTLQVIDLNEAIRSALTLTARKALAHSIRLDLDFHEDRLPILGTKTQIEQVVINLINNAVSSLDRRQDEDKHIVLRTFAVEEKEADPSQNTDRARVVKGALLTIEDNGLGLPAAELNRLFDPALSLPPPVEKVGLGLVIAKMFVGQFKGRISASDNADGGSIFKVWFPLAPE